MPENENFNIELTVKGVCKALGLEINDRKIKQTVMIVDRASDIQEAIERDSEREKIDFLGAVDIAMDEIATIVDTFKEEAERSEA